MLRSTAGKEAPGSPWDHPFPAAEPMPAFCPVPQAPKGLTDTASELEDLCPTPLAQQRLWSHSQLTPSPALEDAPHQPLQSDIKLARDQLRSLVHARMSCPLQAGRYYQLSSPPGRFHVPRSHSAGFSCFPQEDMAAVEPLTGLGEYTRVPVISPKFSLNHSPKIGEHSQYQQVLRLCSDDLLIWKSGLVFSFPKMTTYGSSMQSLSASEAP